MKRMFLGFYVLAMIFLTSGMIIAQPSIPNQFWGTVTDANGNPAPDGVLIVAEVGNLDVAATTTLNGMYGVNPIFYIQDPSSNRLGKTIVFSSIRSRHIL